MGGRDFFLRGRDFLLVDVVGQSFGLLVGVAAAQIHHRGVVVLGDVLVVGLVNLDVVLVGLVVVVLDLYILVFVLVVFAVAVELHAW
ncbi:MAG: hypothetical protein IJ570_00775, partial [Prevotella sp.]|nr:hypothetical protein [Prevotella sp.]